MKNYIDLSKILKNYSDEWVALSMDESRVVSSGKTVKEALDKAHKLGERDPIVTKVPKDYGSYIL